MIAIYILAAIGGLFLLYWVSVIIGAIIILIKWK